MAAAGHALSLLDRLGIGIPAKSQVGFAGHRGRLAAVSLPVGGQTCPRSGRRSRIGIGRDLKSCAEMDCCQVCSVRVVRYVLQSRPYLRITVRQFALQELQLHIQISDGNILLHCKLQQPRPSSQRSPLTDAVTAVVFREISGLPITGCVLAVVFLSFIYPAGILAVGETIKGIVPVLQIVRLHPALRVKVRHDPARRGPVQPHRLCKIGVDLIRIG